MKTLLIIGLISFFVLSVVSKDFVNLGFENPDLSAVAPEPGTVVPRGFAPIDKLLPGWSLEYGGRPVTEIAYEPGLVPLNYFGPEILTIFPYLDNRVFQGTYSLTWQESSPSLEGYVLHQRGIIPLEAKELIYSYSGLHFQLKINGDVLTPKVPPPFFGSSFTLLAFDISRYSGQEVELAFETALPNLGGHIIHDITFSIPEPSTCAILGLWFIWLGGRIWSRSKR